MIRRGEPVLAGGIEDNGPIAFYSDPGVSGFI
jgi:hypothetical protein